MNKKNSTNSKVQENGKNATEKTQKRRFDGIVVSDKMQKTVVVRIDSTKIVPGIKKRITTSKRFKAHDEKGESKTGDKVTIEECRPLSKDKRWRIVKN